MKVSRLTIGLILMAAALLSCSKPQEIHFNRFGLDGTLKHSAVIPKTIMPIYDYLTWEGFPVNELKQCSESPLKYR